MMTTRGLVLACAVLLLAAPVRLFPQAPSAQGPRSLAGLWGVEQSFGPLVRGELTIDGRQAPWTASTSGFQALVQRSGDRITLVLPGGAGEFRGHLDTAGRVIDGDWLQPAGVVNNNRYATPVRLSAVSPRVWRGSVVPEDDRISFYVSIQSQPGGALRAVIINPEFNLFRRRSYDVTLHGSAVTFTNPKRSNDTFTGAYDRATDTFSLHLLDAVPPLLLSRRDQANAVGYFARTPATGTFAYAVPIPGADGWATASLADVGLDQRPIASLVEKILSAPPDDNPVDIDSLLIARHGKLVFEQYFHGYDASRPHDMRSASKTFAPVLAGLAHDRGAPISPDTPVFPLFSDQRPFAHLDARKSRLSLRDLMTMTSGFACDDNNDSSPGNEDNMQNQSAQPDWYKYTLDLPMAADPGGRHAIYCSGDLNLVGGAVARATHSWLPEFFDRYLARPLQFGTYHMNLMPTGEAYMGGGLHLLPRDELKLGQLYLSRGVWNGKRIISADWVRESTTAHSTFDPQTDYDAPHEYGFGWHINQLHAGNRTFRVFGAGGNGGQIVMVIPDLDMVVAFNGGSYGEFAKWYRWGLQLVPQYIIPAALGPPTR